MQHSKTSPTDIAVQNRIADYIVQTWHAASLRYALIFIISWVIPFAANAQTKPISLTAKNTPIKEALREIEQKSGCRILYNDEVVPDGLRVSVNAENVAVKDLLNLMLQNTELTFVQQSDVLIVITRKEFTAPANQITGLVVDETGEPVPFANVVQLALPDSAFINGVSTGVNGRFSLERKSNNPVLLEITYLGYERLHAEVTDNNLGTIRLTPEATVLGEVVVTASNIIMKTDRLSIIPSQQIIKYSVSGYDLLNKLMLPGLRVDIVNKSISKMGGGSVPIYINEKKATQADVIALRPDEVLNVEYIDAPGVQYANDNAEAVINFVVKQRISGFITGINATNAITTGNGNNFYFLKYNNKLSEFGFTYNNEYGIVKDRYINQTDSYKLLDNTTHIIQREGVNTNLKYAQHNVQLTYNLSKPQKYVFEANLRGTFYDSPKRGHKQTISETGKQTYYSLTEPTEKYHSPVLDLFYRLYLPKKQTFTANFVGTLIDTKYGYSYKTFADDKFLVPQNKYGYETDGKKYSLIGEARYNKQFDAFSFITGLNHLEGYTQNKYTGSNNVINEMNNAITYLYSQIQGSLNNLNYIAGAGISYQTYKQENNNYNYWLFRPSLTLSYVPLKNANLRYRFYVSPRIPSLASLSDVRQQSNDYEFRLGNPNLKPYWDATNMLIFSYQHKRFYIENTLGYTYSNNPIMENIIRKADNSGRTFFEFGFENQKRHTQFWNYIAAQLYIIPEKLTLQGGLSYLTYLSEGNTYLHKYDRLWTVFQADLMLGKWNLGATWNSRESNFFGESINYGSSYSNLYANYQLNNMTFGMNWSYMFLKDGHTSGEKTLNEFVNKDLKVFVPEWGNMISITFSWNFTKGREYQSQRKTINNADTDSGILKY